LKEALQVAAEEGLDLVEVAPLEKPPVCRIMDYGKYKYEQERKAKKARKKQSLIVVKEIKFRPKIDNHDFIVKRKHVERFLNSGAKVKVTIMFRGREMDHADIGKRILDRLAEEVGSLGSVESAAKINGRDMVMVLAPVRKREAG
jgi:translation initiation factor IF-3